MSLIVQAYRTMPITILNDCIGVVGVSTNTYQRRHKFILSYGVLDFSAVTAFDLT
jgi:hypothetical protein